MPRGDQVSRQLRIIRLLERSKTGFTISELHHRLDEVASERTIRRDIEDIEKAGFVLSQDDGGRWHLPAGEGIASIPILPSELLSVMLSLDLLEALRPSEVVEGLRSLRDKLSDRASTPVRKFAQLLKKSLLGTYTAPVDLPDRDPRIEAIEEGIRAEHQLEIEYRSPGREQLRRLVDPYCLWFADGRLYLIGWCHLRSAFRTFHVSRIGRVSVLDQSFEVDPQFDAREFVGAGFGVWSGEQHDVELVFDEAVAHVPMERKLHASQTCDVLDDGRVLVSFRAGGVPQLAAWLAGFGGLVRVVRPSLLREMVLQIHQRGVRAYCSEDQQLEAS